jgi:hypothetical protein
LSNNRGRLIDEDELRLRCRQHLISVFDLPADRDDVDLRVASTDLLHAVPVTQNVGDDDDGRRE